MGNEHQSASFMYCHPGTLFQRTVPCIDSYFLPHFTTGSQRAEILRLITSSAAGNPADDESVTPRNSWGGRFIVFASRAKNLPIPGLKGLMQIFLYDTHSGDLRLVSRDAQGDEATQFLNRPEQKAFSWVVR